MSFSLEKFSSEMEELRFREEEWKRNVTVRGFFLRVSVERKETVVVWSEEGGGEGFGEECERVVNGGGSMKVVRRCEHGRVSLRERKVKSLYFFLFPSFPERFLGTFFL